MMQDPIVQEIRAVRDQIAREHDYDIDSIFEALRNTEASSGRKHVTLKPRKTAQHAGAANKAPHRR